MKTLTPLALIAPAFALQLVAALQPTADAQVFAETFLFNRTAPGRLRPLLTDVDGDGLVDLLATSEGLLGGPNSLIWQRAIAPGEFTGAVPLLTAPGGVNRPYLADVDGDGDLDLISYEIGSSLRVHVRTSAGFASPSISVGPISSLPLSMNVGDVDGDGDVDIVHETLIGLMGGSRLFVVRGDGSGSFGAPQEVASIAPAEFLRLKQVVDVDGDGDDDILVNRADSELVLIRSLGATGFGAEEVLDGATAEIGAVIQADVTGDGVRDLVYGSVAAQASVRFVPGLGGGAFGPPSSLELGTQNFVSDLRFLDLDADGQGDLLVRTSEDLLWLRGLGGGAYAAAAPANLGGPGGSTGRMELADLTGDGVLDVIGELDIQPDRSALALLPGRGAGASPPFGQPVQLGASQGGELIHALGDIDGNGVPELIGMDRADVIQPVAFTAQPEGTAAGAPTPRFSRQELGAIDRQIAQQLVLADLTGDQRDDAVLIADGVLAFLPAALSLGFAPAVDLGPVDPTVRPALEDIDLDGAIDIVASSGVAREVVWFRNLGAGVFGGQQPVQAAQNPISEVRFADLDGDGQRDLVVAELQTLPGPMQGRVVWSPREGAATFGSRRILSAGGPIDATALTVGDVDGDGLFDVVWGSELITSLRWARNLGAGLFAGAETLITAGNFCDELQLVDLDGDGDQDLVIRLRRSIRIALNQGAGAFGTSLQLGVSTTWMTVGDLDADGDPDVTYSIEFSPELGYRENLSIDPVGDSYCGPAVLNASGASGVIAAAGSASVAQNELRLIASDLPASAFGYFLVSDLASTTFPVPASVGRLCLGGSIGRYVGPGQVLNSGPAGLFDLQINLFELPTPTGPVAAGVGETRFFQAWFRDIAPGGSATSNFTDALSVTWL